MTEKKHNINRNTRQTLVQSVERALDILEIVGNAGDPVRNGEIASLLGVSPATANNLIRTLYARGYLNQHRGGRYTLGMQTFILGNNADVWSELRTASLEPLQKLSQAIQVTCFLGRHDRTSLIGDQRFDLRRVQRVIGFLHIAKYGSQSAPRNGVGGGHKGERGGDDLTAARQIQRR